MTENPFAAAIAAQTNGGVATAPQPQAQQFPGQPQAPQQGFVPQAQPAAQQFTAPAHEQGQPQQGFAPQPQAQQQGFVPQPQAQPVAQAQQFTAPAQGFAPQPQAQGFAPQPQAQPAAQPQGFAQPSGAGAPHDPFASPTGPGEGHKIKDDMGAAVLVRPEQFTAQMQTANGPSDVIRCDWAVLTGPNAGQLRSNALIFNAAMVRDLNKVLNGPQRFLVGVVAEGVAKGTKSAPLIFRDAPEHMDAARAAAAQLGWV